MKHCHTYFYFCPSQDIFGASYTLYLLIYPTYSYIHIRLKYVGYICWFHKFTKFSQRYWLNMNKLPLSLCLSSYLSETAARRLQSIHQIKFDKIVWIDCSFFFFAKKWIFSNSTWTKGCLYIPWITSCDSYKSIYMWRLLFVCKWTVTILCTCISFLDS